ncbi:MAG: MFS transporter [Ktedonobacteraceae bacterium]|nr:MFS transporter [Chloroflexota bacterium]
MLLEAGNTTSVAPKKRQRAATIIARQDRISIWALPILYLVIIGIGFLFTFFDIFDINVSFIQTCIQIVPHCDPVTAGKYLGLPVLLNLVGYVAGSLILSPLADRYGRRDLLVITLILTGIGSLYTAFVGDYTNFIIARTITGIGIGADLALVNTYLNEIAPGQGRVKYTAFIFIMSSLGAFLGIWLGLYLTTPATPFPLGLPFAIAGPQFEFGWRVMYIAGALLAAIGLLFRFQLPESPRWLVSRGRLSEADRVVTAMEKYASARLPSLPPVPANLPVLPRSEQGSYIDILGNSLYLKRTILILVIWLVGYISVYSIAAGLTTLLAALQYPPPEAGLIAATGTFGFIACAVTAYLLGEKMERKYWLLLAGVLTLLGGIIIALSDKSFGIAALGSIILFFGFNIWIPMTYTWSTENYPTRARATGFALVDGIGHIGGGVGVTFIASVTVKIGPLATFVLIGGFLLAAAGLAQFGTATRQKRLDEVSP